MPCEFRECVFLMCGCVKMGILVSVTACLASMLASFAAFFVLTSMQPSHGPALINPGALHRLSSQCITKVHP